MRLGHFKTLVYVMGLLIGLVSLCAKADPLLLPRAHAHNDYEHEHPLFDALAQGFCSVEADIYLTNGHLLVAHDIEKVWSSNTLERLYLDPLLKRVKQNKGHVYAKPVEFTLLIDIKSDAEPTYAVLRDVLKKYKPMLTSFSDERTATNAVTIILSGNRPQASVAAEKTRYVSIDGRLTDLEGSTSRHLIPLISDNWTKHFQWRGQGPLPVEDKEKLARIVKTTHAQGRKLRFWAVADDEVAWKELLEAGVDVLNTDHLAAMQTFLKARQQ